MCEGRLTAVIILVSFLRAWRFYVGLIIQLPRILCKCTILKIFEVIISLNMIKYNCQAQMRQMTFKEQSSGIDLIMLMLPLMLLLMLFMLHVIWCSFNASVLKLTECFLPSGVLTWHYVLTFDTCTVTTGIYQGIPESQQTSLNCSRDLCCLSKHNLCWIVCLNHTVIHKLNV